jgi:hypothetical protein
MVWRVIFVKNILTLLPLQTLLIYSTIKFSDLDVHPAEDDAHNVKYVVNVYHFFVA